MEIMIKIRQYRQSKGISQTELAEALGIAQTQYSRYERGACEMPLRYFKLVCNYLKMDANWALGVNQEGR